MQSDPIFPDEFMPGEGERARDRIRPRRLRRWLILAIIGAAILVWPMWAEFYTDWLWFNQLGYQNVFTTTLFTKVILGIVVGLVTTIVIWLNYKLALRLSPESRQIPRFLEIEGQRVQAPDLSRIVDRLALIAPLAAGVFAGLAAWGAWEIYLRFVHQVRFEEADPIFNRDISFYFFTLPAYESLTSWVSLMIVASLIGAALIYLVRGALIFNQSGGSNRIGFGFSISRQPRSHLLALLAAWFLIFAVQGYLAMPNLLFGQSGPVAGASYTDINANLPILYIKVGVAVLLAVMAVVSIFLSSTRLIWAGVAIYALMLVGGWLYPAIVQRFSVGPNELAKETPYLEKSIAATRKAFGLDKIEERELTGEKALTARNIQENQRTIKNIRLWDKTQLLETFTQIQEFRTYYAFKSVDNDRYLINGELQQTMISPREMEIESLQGRNWINDRLNYTHGFGLTVGPVDQITPQGQPVLYIKDIPPSSSISTLKIDRPEIYFGELTNDHVYVMTDHKEFNYPSGEDNVLKNYDGNGGVEIGSKWRQILFGTRFGDLKLVLSDLLKPESRVLFNRNIKQRVSYVAPYLDIDEDPYMVINEGRLFWIADAYTFSNRYPYSQTYDGINYIRNSVKAVIDAYNGDVSLYISDERDPLIRTYARIYPGTLKPLSEMPQGLRSHIRYPEKIFKLQSRVYSTYHMDQPQVFYNKEDLWTAALMGGGGRQGGDGAGGTLEMEPYYTIMRLPEEKTEEFILMLPFTPKNKDNLAAWMVARADGENYGKLVVYRTPKQKLVYGPKQIVALVNQEPEISRQLSLWNTGGSTVILGTLMVIPIEESLIYVQPLYLLAQSGRIPELRRVIVAAEDKIAMEPTLDQSLARIFGEGTAPTEERPPDLTSTSPPGATAPPKLTVNTVTLAGQAKQHYDRAIQAQREGDWGKYGE
ncbi:MAG: UPF0182 family protein, partial [Acidobacteria bacterium]|nr:UPF0182 family protein [Acidobacteriota bacterium]